MSSPDHDRHDAQAGSLHLVIPVDIRQVRLVRLLTKSTLESVTAITTDRVQRFLVAITEVFNNAVRTMDSASENGVIEYEMVVSDSHVMATVTDTGGGFSEHQSVDSTGLGAGLKIAEAFSDSIDIRSAGGRTAVSLSLSNPT